MSLIISIDLDIITSPYGGLWRDYISDKTSREFTFTKLPNYVNYDNFEVNQAYVEKIKQIITTYQDKVDTVYLGLDHSSLLGAIEREKTKLQQDYRFDIYNIDLHHDITYNQFDENSIVDSGICNCGNWVGYLNFNNYVKTYHWYQGIDSSFDKEKMSDIKNPFCPKRLDCQVGLESFPMTLDDSHIILYITFSPPWMPMKFDKSVLDILSVITKPIYYFDTGFFVNSCRKPFLNNSGEHYFYSNLKEGFLNGSDL